jgi:hypothetical protein
MGALTNNVIELASGLVPRKVAEQGGVISGANPAAWNASDPLPLWVIQVGACGGRTGRARR